MQNSDSPKASHPSLCSMRCCSANMGLNDSLLLGVKLVIKCAFLQQAAMKLYDVVEVDQWALLEFPGMIGHTAGPEESKNLVWISIKLALIFSRMTVTDTEPICAVIKAALRWDGFHYRPRWFIYLDSDCILQIGLFFFFLLEQES